MRNPDWGGNPPKNAKEAKVRLLSAALHCVEKYGLAKTTIARVANEAGVTRQTVYRHFESTEAMHVEVSVSAGGEILDRLLKHCDRFNTFADRVVESILFLTRELPKDDYLKIFFTLDSRSNEHVLRSFAAEGIDYSYQMLKAMYPVGQKPASDKWLRELAIHMQRTLFSLMVISAEDNKSPKATRAYLNRWLKPFVET